MNHERLDDLPPYLKWIMTFINRVGFPVLVCIWLAYQQFVLGKETVKAISEFKEVMISVKDTLEQQNRILRNNRGRSE
jgi:hypothetical protein